MVMYGAGAGKEYDGSGDEGGSVASVRATIESEREGSIVSSSRTSGKATVGSENDGEGSRWTGSVSSEGSGGSKNVTTGSRSISDAELEELVVEDARADVQGEGAGASENASAGEGSAQQNSAEDAARG
jgi:hypothetical protein